MRRVLLVAAGIALALLVFILIRVGSPSRGEPIDTSAASASERAQRGKRAFVESVRAPLDVEARSALTSDGVPSDETHVPHHRVTGRIVDEDGAPIGSVHVTLAVESGPWTEGQSIARVRGAFGDVEGFESTSAADGRFAFEVPRPTTPKLLLLIDASTWHGRLTRGIDVTPLRSGDSDLGVFALTTCGAVGSRVVDENGAPLAGVRVSLPLYRPFIPSPSTLSDEHGSFRLDGVREGVAILDFASPEHAAPLRVDGISVQKRMLTTIDDVVLARAPGIRGTVVDVDGAPVPRARVEGRDQSTRNWSYAESNEEGRFLLLLPLGREVDLAVSTLELGLRCESVAPLVHARSGDEDVVVRMTVGHAFTFHIVEDATQLPIERYGLELHGGDGPKPRVRLAAWPTIESHVGGDLTVHGSVQGQFVGVVAEGFAAIDTAVQPDASDGNVQTIRMHAGGELRGRLVVRDRPLALGIAALERGRLGDRDPNDPSAFDLNAFQAPRRTVNADAQGAFEVRNLASGTYCLRVEGRGNSPFVLDAIRIEAGATRDLGNVELQPAAVLRGRARTGAGWSPVGLLLFLDGAQDATVEIDDVDGRFEIATLSPGEHVLTWDWPIESWGRAGAFTRRRRPSMRVTLAAGETRDVEIDASSVLPGRVTARVVDHGRPRAGVRVRAFIQDDGLGLAIPLARTGADGTTFGLCPPGIRSTFDAVDEEEGTVLGRSAEVVVLAPGSDHEVTITLASGRLVVEFPADFELPQPGSFYVWLTETKALDRRLINWLTPGVRAAIGGGVRWTGHRCDLGPVATGDYKVDVELWRIEYPPGDDTRGVVTAMRPRWRTTVQIQNGETSTLIVPP